MKMCEMTPKEKTAVLEAYCRANESSDIRFEWKMTFNNYSNRYSGPRLFTLIMSHATPELTQFAYFQNIVTCSGFTKHDALKSMFNLIMRSRQARELETVKSFEEMAMLNAIRGDMP